jgi:hypothetical protein
MLAQIAKAYQAGDDAFWKTPGPVDLAGYFSTFDQAWIGRARQHKPRVSGRMATGQSSSSWPPHLQTGLPPACRVISSPERA